MLLVLHDFRRGVVSFCDYIFWCTPFVAVENYELPVAFIVFVFCCGWGMLLSCRRNAHGACAPGVGWAWWVSFLSVPFPCVLFYILFCYAFVAVISAWRACSTTWLLFFFRWVVSPMFTLCLLHRPVICLHCRVQVCVVHFFQALGVGKVSLWLRFARYTNTSGMFGILFTVHYHRRFYSIYTWGSHAHTAHTHNTQQYTHAHTRSQSSSMDIDQCLCGHSLLRSKLVILSKLLWSHLHPYFHDGYNRSCRHRTSSTFITARENCHHIPS